MTELDKQEIKEIIEEVMENKFKELLFAYTMKIEEKRKTMEGVEEELRDLVGAPGINDIIDNNHEGF